MNTHRNYTSIVKKYGPGFVALSKKTGKVIASGRNIKELWEKADKKRIDFSNIVISHLPKYGVISLY